MSQAREEGREPRTNLRRAYEHCLAARRQLRSVRGKTANPEVREEAHGDLHEAVLAWFEALVPYISERPGEVKQLWETAPLYPQEPSLVAVVRCGNDACGLVVDRDEADVSPGDQCPQCAVPLEPDKRVERDEEGRILYDWACGLKRLSNWTDETTQVTVDSGKWATGSDTVEMPKRLDTDVLLRAARYLDLAAEECGLLEDTDRALEVGDLG